MRHKPINVNVTFRGLEKWNKQMFKIIRVIEQLKKEITILENIRIDFDAETVQWK